MKNALKTALNAVANSDVIPVMQHFLIRDGHVTATDGRVTYTTPVPELDGLSAVVPAHDFFKACEACDFAPTFDQDGDALVITKGRFRSELPSLPMDEFPEVTGVTDDWKALEDGFLSTLNKVAPFIAKKSAYRWAFGVLIRNGLMYATNNYVIVRAPLGTRALGDDCVIPAQAVAFLQKAGREPVAAQRASQHAAFLFDDGAHLVTSLVLEKWPEKVAEMFKPVGDTAIPCADLRKALTPLKRFAGKYAIVTIDDGRFQVKDGRKVASVSTEYDVTGAAFNMALLWPVLEAADRIAITGHYPAPCPFSSDDGFEGVIAGVRR